MRKVRVKNLPKDKGWKEYKTPTGESLYLDPRFKDQRYYVNEKGDHVTPDQNMSLFDVENDIWESGTSLPPLEVSPKYKYVQRPGALGAMETIRIDLDNGSQEVTSPDVMATKREMDAVANTTINPAGFFVTGIGNIAQGNIGEGALQTAFSIPVVGQAVGNVIGAPFKFARQQIAQTYGPALSEVGRLATTKIPLKNAWRFNPSVEVPKPTSSFKSEIDWAKWNKKTPKYPELINEYNAIEESTKKAGTWLKNPDGTEFKGSPSKAFEKKTGMSLDDQVKAQFIQQQSSWFKKAFPNAVRDEAGNIQFNYHGQRDGKPFSIFKPSERGAHGVGNYTFPNNREAALRYAKGDESRLYDLYINSNNPQQRIESVFSPEFNSYTGRIQPGYDYLRVGKEQVTPAFNYLKSALGNVGFFDMTNPDIYKGLIPFIGAGYVGSKLYNSQQQEPAYKKGFVSFENGGPKDPPKKLTREQEDKIAKDSYNGLQYKAEGNVYHPYDSVYYNAASMHLQNNPELEKDPERLKALAKDDVKRFFVDANKIEPWEEKGIDLGTYAKDVNQMLGREVIATPFKPFPMMASDVGFRSPEEVEMLPDLSGTEIDRSYYPNTLYMNMANPAYKEPKQDPNFVPSDIYKIGGTNLKKVNMKKVRITGLPKAAMGGFPYNQTAPNYLKDDMGEKHMRIGKVLEGVPRDQANIEAEKGETVVIPNVGGLSAHYKIGGKRHHSGGTPLNVPEDSFIFSDTKAMKIKDPDLLKEFGMPEKKGGYTPAEIAKKYDINKYREILQDPEQDNLAKDTAEKMIKSFNLKLGKLALVQEAIKGFPTGIPLIALPYMEANSIEPEDILPDLNKEEQNSETEVLDNDAEEMMDENPEIQRYGGIHKKGNLDIMNKLKKVRVNMNTMMDPNNGLYIMEPGGSAPPSNQKTKVVNKKAKIPSDAIIIKKADYKTDAEYIAARDKAFKEAADKSKVFIDLGDGNYKRVQSKAFQFPEYKGTDLDKAFKGNKEIANRYQYIEDRILGNPELKQKLYDETIAILEETKKKLPKSITSRAVKVENIDNLIANLDPDKVAKNFLEMQKRNLALSSHLGAEGVKGSAQTPISGATSNEVLTKAAADAGINMPDALGTVLQQASYVAFDNLADRKEAPGFKPGQFGAADEKKGKKLTISPVDAIYTNTTSGQITGIAGEDSIEETDPDMEEIKDESDPYRTKDPLDGYYPQDEANLALALRNKYRAKKYMPWVAPVNLQQPDIVYHDPTAAQQRALSAYNTGVRGANVYGTGNSSGRLSEFMKKAMENSALIEAQTQQADVAVTNQFNAQKADTWNKSQFANADIGTSLYDKVIAANQAYDNTNTANDQLVTQMKNAMETNAAYTYNINSMNPNFQIDPRRKGRVRFYQGSKMNPGQSQTFADIYADLRANENLSTLDDETLADIAKEQAGITTSSTRNKGDNNPNASYMAMYNQIYPGQVGPPMLQEESKD